METPLWAIRMFLWMIQNFIWTTSVASRRSTQDTMSIWSWEENEWSTSNRQMKQGRRCNIFIDDLSELMRKINKKCAWPIWSFVTHHSVSDNLDKMKKKQMQKSFLPATLSGIMSTTKCLESCMDNYKKIILDLACISHILVFTWACSNHWVFPINNCLKTWWEDC